MVKTPPNEEQVAEEEELVDNGNGNGNEIDNGNGNVEEVDDVPDEVEEQQIVESAEPPQPQI